MLGSVARSARRLLPANASGARCFGIASAVPPETTLMAFTAADEADISLRMSLAADRLTTRGDAVRNPDLRVLLQQLPRGVEISKSRVVRSTGAAAAAAPVVRATDAINGAGAVADVEEFEAELADVVDNRLSFAPMLFVQDGAMGASRSTEIRTRVITDSPLTALAARALLHRVPLYNAQVFPRTITVYAATRQYAGAVADAASVAVDVDPATARATVLLRGPVSASAFANAIAVAGGALSIAGGYRHVPGGAHDPNLSEARSDGVLDWYLRDGHFYARADEPQPETALLAPGAATVLGRTLVIGRDVLAAAVSSGALAGGKVQSGAGAVWHPTEGVSAPFAGLLMPAAAASGAAAAALPAGSVIYGGEAVVPWAAAAARSFGAPSRVVVVGERPAGGASPVDAAIAAVAKASGWANANEKADARLRARLSAPGVAIEFAPSPAAAAAAALK